MYRIVKQFDFCYGHRVHNQQLNPEFSLDSCHACRRLHGHQGSIHVTLEGEVLENGMLTDFKHFGAFRKWIDDTLDHKFIMDIKDPAKELMFPLLRKGSQWNPGMEQYTLHTVGDREYATVNEQLYNHPDLEQPVSKEIYEGLVFVNFVPTSENLSKWLLDIVQEKMNPLGVKVAQLEFYETPKSKSIYIA